MRKINELINEIYRELFKESPDAYTFRLLLLELDKAADLLSIKEFARFLGLGPYDEIDRRKWELLFNGYEEEVPVLFPEKEWIKKRIDNIHEKGFEVDLDKSQWIVDIFIQGPEEETVKDLYESSMEKFLLDQIDTIFPYLLAILYKDLLYIDEEKLTEELVRTLENYLTTSESIGADREEVDKAIGYLTIYGTLEKYK